MSGIRIATRYAKSLLDLCIEQGQLDVVKIDMDLIANAINQSRDLRVMLSSPVVKADKKVEILNMIFKSHVSDLSMKFIILMTNKGREGFLHEIVTSFINQLRAHRGITTAEVISAVVLDSMSKKNLQDTAVRLAGGPIELVEKTDASLIGGFILKVGDRQIDSSISARIKGLKREFADNPYVAEF